TPSCINNDERAWLFTDRGCATVLAQAALSVWTCARVSSHWNACADAITVFAFGHGEGGGVVGMSCAKVTTWFTLVPLSASMNSPLRSSASAEMNALRSSTCL